MSRYFFDLHNGDGPTTDHEGLDLVSREAVKREVARILVDLARDEMPIEQRAVISVKVRNATGKVISVSSLTFNNEWLE